MNGNRGTTLAAAAAAHEGTSKPHSNHNWLKKSSVSHTIPAVAREEIGRQFVLGRFVSYERRSTSHKFPVDHLRSISREQSSERR